MASGSSWQSWWGGGDRWCSEEGRGGESWRGWEASGGEPTGGSRAPPPARRHTGGCYAETGEHSFRELSAVATDLDCTVTTRDRRVPGRPTRAGALTVKGFQRYAVYQAFLDAATSLHADLSRVNTETITTHTE